MKPLLLLVVFSILATAARAQVRPQPRSGAGKVSIKCDLNNYHRLYFPNFFLFEGCVYIKSRIYCYGGRSIGKNTAQSTNMNDMYYLDVSKDFSVQQGQSSWQSLSPGGLSSPPNYLFGFVPIYDAQMILMQGGVGYDNGTGLQYPNIVYDPNSNNWRNVRSVIVPQTWAFFFFCCKEYLSHGEFNVYILDTSLQRRQLISLA